jgi:hypothetical protein
MSGLSLLLAMVAGVVLGMVIGAAPVVITAILAKREERARRAAAEPDWDKTHG